jgi:4-amino-4-deoxy-L-arabinose transferase-like glycosyltransferase
MAYLDQLVRGVNAYIALALIVVIASLPGLIAMPTLDRDEARFAEASSEMLQTGDFVVIRYHDELRSKKPVGIHWLQAATVAATGGEQARNISIYRIPSLLGAILAAWSTFWIGATLFNRRAGFIAAATLACTLLLSTEAHIAKTDAAQCGFICLMMAALVRLRQEPDKRAALLFWFALAMGVLLKAVIAPMIAALTIGGLFFFERKLNWLKPLLQWSGVTLFCVMTIPWLIAVQIATGGEFMFVAAKVDLGQKIVNAAEGHGAPPGFHTAALPFLFWPGTLLLIPGITQGIIEMTRMRRKAPASNTEERNPAVRAAVLAWQSKEADAWRLLACWLAPSWLVFELTPTKLMHYTLPLYPAIALMCGAATDRWLDTGKWTGVRWISLALFAIVTALVAAAATPWALQAIRDSAALKFGAGLRDQVSWIWKGQWEATNVGFWPSFLIVVISGATIYAFILRQAAGVLAGLLACSLIGGVTYRTMILPRQSWVLSTDAAISALTEICALPQGSQRWKESGCTGRAPTIVRAIGYAEPSLVFELGGKITLPPDSSSDLPGVTEDNRPAWLIDQRTKEGKAAVKALVDQAAAADRCIRFARRYVQNYSNGSPEKLVAVVIEPAGCLTQAPTDLRPAQDNGPELEGDTKNAPRAGRAPGALPQVSPPPATPSAAPSPAR